MSENPNAFKHAIDGALVVELADRLGTAHPALDRDGFIRAARAGLEALELKARVRHVADSVGAALPGDPRAVMAAIGRALGPPPPGDPDLGLSTRWYAWPLCQYVGDSCVDHPELALPLLRELTQHFSAEFAIRPFIETHPELTLATLERWSSDPNVHVRRLVSEGTRPRLPWGRRLRALQADPRPALGLLEALRDDPYLYVRRSVANHLNDISKDHPALVVDICRRWMQESTPERRWLVRHALRTRVKAADTGALEVLGHGAPRLGRVRLQIDTPRVPIGGELRFRVSFRARGEEPQSLLIDYAIDLVRARGETRRKVFKWTRRTVAPRQQVEIARAQSFRPVTTRRYYPGEHCVALLINGVAVAERRFQLHHPG